MFLLDNNALKIALSGNEAMRRQITRYTGQVYLSSVAAQEWLAGYMSGINRAQSPRNSLSLPQAHQDFAQALEDLQAFPLFVYSNAAEAIYQTFSPATLRIGPQDCRIAAQALAHGLTVVTRNLRDFEAIGARCTDWSA